MNILQIIILAVIQGFAELLPVSSSAHVIVAERLMGLDPGSPEMTFLLVMLHTGTMFAVLIYFWSRWLSLIKYWKEMLVATFFTGIIGLGLQLFIEKIVLRNQPHAEIENLFRNLPLIACALAAAGILIIIAGRRENARENARENVRREHGEITLGNATLIGIVQGICLPFRGFSRSGATISTGLLMNIARSRAEEFSFALAVILTPPVIARETYRLLKIYPSMSAMNASAYSSFLPGLLGMVFSFLAGLLALRWLSTWLEEGRWKLFGYYCLIAAVIVLAVHFALPA